MGLRLLMSMSVPAAIILAVLAPNFVLVLFGSAYLPSVTSMQILSLSVITVAISNFMGYQILISLGKEKIGPIFDYYCCACKRCPISHLNWTSYGAQWYSPCFCDSRGCRFRFYQLHYVSKYVSFRVFVTTRGAAGGPVSMKSDLVRDQFVYTGSFPPTVRRSVRCWISGCDSNSRPFKDDICKVWLSSSRHVAKKRFTSFRAAILSPVPLQIAGGFLCLHRRATEGQDPVSRRRDELTLPRTGGHRRT